MKNQGIKRFPFTLNRRNLKRNIAPIILDLRLRKTLADQSQRCRDVIVFEKPFFKKKKVFPAH